MEPGDILMTCGLAIMILIVVIQWYLVFRVLKDLQEQFPEKWRELGRPRLVMNNSIANNLALYRFLWRKEYLILGSISFANLCGKVRSFSIFGIGASIVWIGGAAFYIATHQVHH
jgi:hypothetical protein